MRSVNGKGLDVRLRLPDWIEGLEQALRARVSKALGRGSVSLGLRVSRSAALSYPVVDDAALAAALKQVGNVARAAEEAGVALDPLRASDVMGLRGVLVEPPDTLDTKAVRDLLLEDFEPVLTSFCEMRAAEGARLADILLRQIDQVEALATQARALIGPRTEAQRETLKAQVARLLETTDAVEPERLAQELALLGVKSDITEEVDRLDAHVAAARALLSVDEPVGRKFDFLTQEFNREANTLCSKSQFAELTAVGLDLKAVIDQMREQVQNVE